MTIIQDNQALKAYHTELLSQQNPRVAMDIEGEFNLHCYGEHLCLVQIFDGTKTVIIDPLALQDWEPLKAFFADTRIEKVVYDRSSDASLLYNKYGMTYANTTDLRIAVALLEAPKQGLSAVLEQFLGVVGENKKKFQRYNWITRPIRSDALRYAAEDVVHLFRLEKVLIAELAKQRLTEEFKKENTRIQNLPIKDNSKNRHKKAKGYRSLNKRQQERFATLFAERDKVAKLVNLPPDRVFKNGELLDWCKRDIYSKEGARKRISSRVSAQDTARFVEVLTTKHKPQ